MTVAELIPVLQMAVGPVVLLTGVGLLIGSLTNRLGRVVDRGRILAVEQLRTLDGANSNSARQLKILARRAQLIQRAIFFAVLCMLFAAILIITLFFIAAFEFEIVWLIGSLFVASMASLIVSLVAFIQELNLALVVFRMDVGKWD